VSEAPDHGSIVGSFRVAYPGFSLSVDLQFPRRGVTALIGPSGCGKTTILRCFAGLIRAPNARLAIGNDVWQDEASGVFLPTHRRPLGMVFQEASLFPHLSVRGNLKYGMRRSGHDETSSGFDAIIELLGIGRLLDRDPAKLSGGERQRVAIARALLTRPELLLMDEPLAALDTKRKLEIIPYLERLREELDIPILYISHSPEEVTRLASWAVVLEAGRVTAAGPTEKVLHETRALFAGDRFSLVSAMHCVAGPYDEKYGLTKLHHAAGEVQVIGRVEPQGRTVRVLVRAADVVLANASPAGLSIRTALMGVISRIELTEEPHALVVVALDHTDNIVAAVTRLAVDEMALKPGSRVHLLLKTVALDERPLHPPNELPIIDERPPPALT
jgi:molybdate transport system ATP-binding protein